MPLTKTLVAPRRAADLNTIGRFLRERNEHPHLVVAYLKLSETSGDASLRFHDPVVDLNICSKYLEGFNVEITALDYRGDKLSASAYAEEAVRKNCDSILVVSDGRKPLFAADLAATLAIESTLPVIVVKP